MRFKTVIVRGSDSTTEGLGLESRYLGGFGKGQGEEGLGLGFMLIINNSKITRN